MLDYPHISKYLEKLRHRHINQHAGNINILFPPPSPLLRMRANSHNQEDTPPIMYISKNTGHTLTDRGEHDHTELERKGYVKVPSPVSRL